jgi:hypothetical protein
MNPFESVKAVKPGYAFGNTVFRARLVRVFATLKLPLAPVAVVVPAGP